MIKFIKKGNSIWDDNTYSSIESKGYDLRIVEVSGFHFKKLNDKRTNWNKLNYVWFKKQFYKIIGLSQGYYKYSTKDRANYDIIVYNPPFMIQ